jgi:hypothetical protein
MALLPLLYKKMEVKVVGLFTSKKVRVNKIKPACVTGRPCYKVTYVDVDGIYPHEMFISKLDGITVGSTVKKNKLDKYVV